MEIGSGGTKPRPQGRPGSLPGARSEPALHDRIVAKPSGRRPSGSNRPGRVAGRCIPTIRNYEDPHESPDLIYPVRQNCAGL